MNIDLHTEIYLINYLLVFSTTIKLHSGINIFRQTGADPEEGRRGRTPTPFCAKLFKKFPKLA